MKLLGIDGLTKLIQLIKASFISVDDTIEVSTLELADVAKKQVAIEASAGYSTLWGRGAGNATVYFDL